MRIGVPRESKDGERRVGLTPDGVRMLVADAHEVCVQRGAGAAVGFPDRDYESVGAHLVANAEEAFHAALIVKVKELQPAEYPMLREGSTIFGFAQLNRDPALLTAVMNAGVTIIACETVRDTAGHLPLLAPMSRIAGRLAPLAGAQALSTDHGGAGVLLTGIDAVPGAQLVVVGAGNVGTEAARVGARLGCRVRVFSRGAARLAALAGALRADGFEVPVQSLAQAGQGFAEAIAQADLIIAGVLEPGTLSPKLISQAMLAAMRQGSALVDVGIDQGGIAASSRPTKLSAPTYVEHGVVHYAVPNMPSLVARTATLALTAATLPYVRKIAGMGVLAALAADPGLAAGVMVLDGAVVHAGLAADVAYAAK